MWVLSSCWDNTGITMFNPEDDNTIVMYPLITLISHTEVLLNSGLGLVPGWCGPAVLSRCHRSPGHHLSPAHPQQPGGDKLMFSGVKWAVAVWQCGHPGLARVHYTGGEAGHWSLAGARPGNMQTDKAVWEQMKVAVKGTKI